MNIQALVIKISKNRSTISIFKSTMRLLAILISTFRLKIRRINDAHWIEWRTFSDDRAPWKDDNCKKKVRVITCRVIWKKK